MTQIIKQNTVNYPLNFMSEYICDIPWSKSPEFIYHDAYDKYKEVFDSVIDVLPYKDNIIAFNENVWDFNGYFKNQNSQSYRITFEVYEDLDLVEKLKFYTLDTILAKKKIPTIKNKLDQIKHFYLRLKQINKTIYTVTNIDIIEYINNPNNSASTKFTRLSSLLSILEYIVQRYEVKLNVDFKKLNIISSKLNKDKKRYLNKINNIPKELYNSILITCVTVMRDNKETYNDRVTASMIIMLAQTGLRINELLCLKTTDMDTTKLDSVNKESSFLRYRSTKSSKVDGAPNNNTTFVTNLCKEAFDTIIELRKTCDYAKDTDWLYVIDEHSESHFKLPIADNRFKEKYYKFLYNKLPDLVLKEWEGIQKKNIGFGHRKNKDDFLAIYAPTTKQYRVHMATTLYEKGISLLSIQRCFGHLSEMMLGYYVRPKDNYQENISYSEKVIMELVDENISPIGVNGEELKDNLKSYLIDNNLDIYEDVHDVIKQLGDKLIIRGKTGGCCIKTSLMNCAKDAKSNEILCAYDLCGNLFHFYYMVDITYTNFKVMQQTYQSNLDRGKTIAAQKELNKIKDICKRKLLPELDELEKEIDIKGKDVIINRDPDLLSIVDNLDNIRKEISTWMKIKKID